MSAIHMRKKEESKETILVQRMIERVNKVNKRKELEKEVTEDNIFLQNYLQNYLTNLSLKYKLALSAIIFDTFVQVNIKFSMVSAKKGLLKNKNICLNNSIISFSYQNINDWFKTEKLLKLNLRKIEKDIRRYKVIIDKLHNIKSWQGIEKSNIEIKTRNRYF
jgi:hypothetical protein